MWKHFINDYFSFTSKGRKGVIIIACIILIVILIPYSYPLFIKHEQYNYSEFQNDIAKLTLEKADSFKTKNYSANNDLYDNSSATNYAATKVEVFYFDPNTASFDEWKRLGLRDKTIYTIQHYLSKGGKFYKPEDISKIWGLSPTDAERLIPYISLKNKPKQYQPYEKKEYAASTQSYTIKKPQLIDINLADTLAFISLPGIGSKLSQRIIAFRNKLGGFYSVDQVGETYLLPDSTFQKIKSRLTVSDNGFKTININVASVDEMKTHPYLRYNIANAIYQYRQQHGNFASVEDVKKVMLITDDMYKKIAPYLTL